VREAVNVAGRAVVDDGDSGRSRHRIASTCSGTGLAEAALRNRA
jgi:hypothetical protein